MKQEINFIVDLKSTVDTGNAITSQGKSVLGNEIKLNELLAKTLEQNLVNYNNNLTNDLTYLFNLINKAQIVELLNTHLEHFFINNSSIEKNAIAFKSLVLVCKFDEEISKEFKNSNSVLLNFEVLLKNNEYKFFIKRIDFMDLPLEKTSNLKVKKIDTDMWKFLVTTNQESSTKGALQFLSGLEMLSNIFNDQSQNDKLKLRQLKRFTIDFRNYNKEKKSDEFFLYYFGDKSLKIDKDPVKDLIFLLELESSQQLPKKHTVIYSYDKTDVDIKVDFEVQSEKNKLIKIDNLIDEEVFNCETSINIESGLVYNKTSEKEELENNYNKKQNELNSLFDKVENDDQENIESKQTSLIKEIKEFAQKLVLLNKEISKLESNIKNLKNKIENLKEIKDKAKDKIFFEVKLKSLRSDRKAVVFEPFNLTMLKDKGWNASSFDKGLSIKYNRYAAAMSNFAAGNYKNPYLSLAIENPNSITNSNIELKSTIKLNAKQKLAAQKALGSSSISYLQGPPGTGKTQTICAVIDHVVNNDEKNVLITSSTNEAINNAFDRLKELTKDNPNMIFYKTIKKENENGNNIFDNTTMYKHFVSAIFENLCPEVDDKSEILSLFNELEELNDVEIDELMFKNFIKKENLKDKLVQEKYFYLTGESLDSFMKKAVAFSKEEQEEFLMSKFERAFINYQDKMENEFDNKIKRIISSLSDNNNIVDFKSLKAKFNFTSSNEVEMFKNLKLNFKKNYEYSDIDINFANIALKKELINVIGLTTSASQEIRYGDISKQLFIEYPIYFEIVDEVSKSTTLEIINTMLLANKVMLAGDYRQLPPHAELEKIKDNDKGITKEFIDYVLRHKSDNTIPSYVVEYYINQKFIDDLNVPFFKKHALEINVSPNSINTSYTALTDSYRFVNEIRELVNISYCDNEKLECPQDFDSSKFKKVILDFGFNSDYPVNIVDTSMMDGMFYDYVKKTNQVICDGQQTSFDQKMFIDSSREIISNSRFNEYNAYAVLKILKNLIKNNPNLKPEEIGIIAMTRSQANVIQQYLNIENTFDDKWKTVKIDTVDNFQGREKEIIIVDTVRAKRNLDSNKEFLKDESRDLSHYKKIERLNVAISRAKNKLILVGAFENHLNEEVKSVLDTRNGEEIISPFEIWYKKIESQLGVFKLWEVK
ncbi:AAA family ATPase [Spiroplasma chinense]|uniref:AAA family ATPase n=1 Tax=Spiroplasma chinense TaxID=216932 RepID=A0A5B9Y4G5_9MOLU|nr:AAA domain-containing protein [Spiroplasma chinense]QEH61974.1 AAA family ATPase [Spiroplasma chinense]